jgi:hypothetical protein
MELKSTNDTCGIDRSLTPAREFVQLSFTLLSKEGRAVSPGRIRKPSSVSPVDSLADLFHAVSLLMPFGDSRKRQP